MTTDTRKQAIITALRAFIAQRPGMDPREYDAAGYRSESRQVTRDRHDAERLLREVELHDSITADAILKECGEGGRLTLEVASRTVGECQNCSAMVEPGNLKVIRRYSERVAPGEALPMGECPKCGSLAHEHELHGVRVDYCTGQAFWMEYRKAVARLMASVLWTWTREQCMPEVGTAPVGSGKAEAGMYWDGKRAVSGGDWLRAHFRREFGKPLAERYFT